MTEGIENAWDEYFSQSNGWAQNFGAKVNFQAGWEACIQYEKDQLAKSLAEFDNDNNDCGSGGCIL